MQTQTITKCIAITLLAAIMVWQYCTDTWLCDYAVARLFMHGNPFHLALNCWALWVMWRKPWWHWMVATAIGVFGISLAHNAVGISAMLFALMGIRWTWYNCRINRVIIAVMLVLSLVLPQLTFIAHAVPFCMGLAVCWINKTITQYEHDTHK